MLEKRSYLQRKRGGEVPRETVGRDYVQGAEQEGPMRRCRTVRLTPPNLGFLQLRTWRKGLGGFGDSMNSSG
jgi:hypothetical protein